jgi:inhibitor of cysteine peptidase
MLQQRYLLIVIVLVLLLSACGAVQLVTPNPNTPYDSIQPANPSKPTGEPAAGELIEGKVYINQVDLMVMESFPLQIAVVVAGDLPTPCHNLEIEVSEPNALNEIHVWVYSVFPADVICVQVLESFEANISIPMAGAADGEYSVYVNGEKVGEFSFPG